MDQDTCTRQDGPTIVIGERVLASPASPALVTLKVNERRAPLLIGGNQESDIWDSYFYPLFNQDLANYQTKSWKRNLTGITLLVRSQHHFERAVEKVYSTAHSDTLIIWNTLTDLPWPINPLSGTPKDAAITMVRLISCFSEDRHSLNQHAQSHVYSHTLLLKYLHTYQDHIRNLSNDENSQTKKSITNTYESLFDSSDCTIDQWLHLYADPYLVRKATETLESLVSNFESQFSSPLSEEEGDTTDSDKAITKEIMVSMRAVIQFMHSCYQVKVNIRYQQTFTLQDRGTPLSYIDVIHKEKIQYPRGHPHSGKDTIIDAYSEQIKDVVNACMYLKTNSVLRNTIAGEISKSDPIYEHFVTGGILLINLADTWGTPRTRAIMDALWMTKIDQAISKRMILSDHSLYITDASPFLQSTTNKFHAVTRSRKRGVFVTLGIPSFPIFRELSTSDQLNRIMASFPNRIFPVLVNNTQSLQNLGIRENNEEDSIRTPYVGSKTALSIFRSSFIEKNKAILMKPLPLPTDANHDYDCLITNYGERI
ncbi:hypothetical protein [Brevibacillus reuszeri]|uniref:hypothetical protein n=1 Tax=Brevibacillus reuszeri TaxID=54915 RepID=UPI000CCC7668|nr:hypothetical protein [Brevibacillus reuszeri]